MHNKIRKYSKRRNDPYKRTGVIVVVLLALLILAVNLITFSYSWFLPEIKKGSGVQYSADLTVRSENCGLSHTKGSVSNGAITYNALTGEEAETKSIRVNANSIQYFRTTVTNYDVNATNISLYIESLPAADNEYGLGIATPSNTYRTFTEAQTQVCILRNAYVKGEQYGTKGQLAIEWFIKTSGTAVTVDLDDLYLMYN